MEAERIPERALALEGELVEALERLLAHELVGDVRAGTGVLAAVRFAPGALAADAALENPRAAMIAAPRF